jgi:hypothetical protein
MGPSARAVVQRCPQFGAPKSTAQWLWGGVRATIAAARSTSGDERFRSDAPKIAATPTAPTGISLRRIQQLPPGTEAETQERGWAKLGPTVTIPALTPRPQCRSP